MDDFSINYEENGILKIKEEGRVTLGTGVDLGQTSAEELDCMGVSSATINSLRPYLGQSGPDAVEVLHRLPLTIQ